MFARMRKKPELRRYMLRIALAMVIYLASLFAAEIFIEDRGLSGVPAYALAALPGIAFASMFFSFARLVIEERDEFFRVLYMRQVMVATGISLSAAAIWGFLENYFLVPHVAAFWWPTLWFFGLGAGAIFNQITMGATGECV